MSEIIGDIYTYMFVHRDSKGIEEYITKINDVYKDSMGNPKEMAHSRGKLLSNSIRKKLGIEENDKSLESQEKIKAYFFVKKHNILYFLPDALNNISKKSSANDTAKDFTFLYQIT